MRLSRFPFCVLLLLIPLLGATDAAEVQRGVVNSLSLTPATALVGATVTATVSGVNPCGAVLINWGDGTAVTHPIVELPITRTHSYTAAGNYGVTARGMGNCDGDASGSVRIEAPPGPGARRQLTAFAVTSPAAMGAPASMTMQGAGSCTVDVAFGDGNTQQVSVELPHTLTHVYAVPRAYNVTASAVPPCEGGRHTARLEVTRRLTTPRLGGIAVNPNPNPAAPGAIIQVAGSGSCSYVLDYGDGNNERRTVALPDRVAHVFPPTGSFVVVATAERPCEGRVEQTFTVERQGSVVERLVVSPSQAPTQSRVNIRIEGRGTCPVTVDFGDGEEQFIEAALPVRIFHSYARPGNYEVFAWTEAPCTGDASAVIQIRR
ncbi:MAG: hypothetical protein ABIP65_07545 [Vicinamibacterales bacterium]